MKRIPLLIAVTAAILSSSAVFAQQQSSIDYNPVTCIRGGEMPVFMVTTKEEGVLGAYFRRLGTTDWCWVQGDNRQKLSSVTLPKFENGVEIEYFFVVVQGKEVVAKSPRLYQAKATDSCETLYSRHWITLRMECMPPGSNPIAQSLGAGYSLRSSSTPTPFSPAEPKQ